MTSEKTYTIEQRIDTLISGGWTLPFEGSKTSNENRTSTTLTDDADMQCLLEANGVYAAQLDVFYTGGAGASEGDLKWDIWAPSGATFRLNGLMRLASDAGALHQMGMTETLGTIPAWTNGLTNDYAMSFSGYVFMGSTAGNLKFRWACQTNTGTRTTVYAGSRLCAARRY